MSWSGSSRRAELPPDWPAIRQRILERDSWQCTWIDNGQRCPAQATDIDHYHRGNNHTDGNLRALCAWHHRHKTGREGNAARTPLTEKRQPEPHPGLVKP